MIEAAAPVNYLGEYLMRVEDDSKITGYIKPLVKIFEQYGFIILMSCLLRQTAHLSGLQGIMRNSCFLNLEKQCDILFQIRSIQLRQKGE